MQRIKIYKTFESQFDDRKEITGLTPEQISFLDENAPEKWSLNSEAGLVDVDGDFDCYRQELTDFKGVRFGRVNDFDCSDNQLRSLEGAPQSVGGGFYCSLNQLSSLEGAPQSVGGGFWCYNNDLKSLEGAPQSVGGGFWCDDFKLKPGQWNLQHWIKMLEDEKGVYSESAKDLIATLPQFYEEADPDVRKIIKFQRMKGML
jgi:hypothetical protein